MFGISSNTSLKFIYYKSYILKITRFNGDREDFSNLLTESFNRGILVKAHN